MHEEQTEPKVHPMRALQDAKVKPEQQPQTHPSSIDRELKELKALEAGIGYSSDKTIALYLGAGRSTIWKWVRDKKLPPPVKITKCHSRWSNPELLPVLIKLGKGCDNESE